jgi:hypothetical protein
MTTMGTPIANGHQLVPLAPAALQKHGPVSALPQRDDPGQSRTVPDSPGRWRHAVSAHRGWLAAVPIVLVNAVAFAGQLAFLRVHLPWPAAGQVLVAVTLESVAVYLAWQAHLALTAGDSALRLRLAAYSFALVIGVMNYSHYMAPHWRPTFAAVTFGLMSVSSPWLWSVHSRRVSRDALMAAGDIDPHAVRLGATRWLWHGYRSARVMRAATWAGEVNPARAIALVYPPAVPAVQPRVDKQADRQADKPGPRKAVPARTALDKAAAVIRDNPHLDKPEDKAELARLAGVSTKTVQRARNGAAKTP